MPEIHREDPISHALTNLGDASRSTTNTQAQLACMLFLLSNTLMKAFQVLGKARNASGIAAIQSGFSSADETKSTGNLIALGGFALSTTGVGQGVGSFKQAQGVAKAVENRANKVAEVVNDTEGMSEALAKDPNLTIQVEAVDEPITAPSDDLENEVFLDAEEEIFYDAEETLSTKQSNPDEQIEDTEIQEDEGKMSVEELAKCREWIEDNYQVEVKNVEANADKIKGLAAPGSGVQVIAQGFSNLEKSKSEKDTLLQQVQQGNQSQEEETARDVKAKADELTKFDPFASNSGSLRG